ncbi:YhcN/YlaJ family sporulation lipoprotein [Paenibacillus sp. MBLB4367]|uniref:YhcN/YlaJ family sporulation lipoprotein n=1 Tax=Paenibacillus sp. MBLB4367 TaxID=3384767 RepID=UPI0039082815
MEISMLGRRSRMLAAAAILALALIGCGTNNGQTKTNSYQNDGLLGTTQANPNNPANPQYPHTYSADTQLIKSTLQQIPGIRSSSIILNGPNAYVNLDLTDDTPLEEAMRIKNEAQTKVGQMMPRYNVKVSTNKSRMLNGGK